MARKEQRKYRVRIREFLNRGPEFPAFVIGIVEDTSTIPDDDKEESWKWGDVTLDFGDCYRRVSFDFPMESHSERANSLYKINCIAKAVNAVRDAIEAEVLSRNARPRKHLKTKKA
jgi:hypothetical protein